MKKRNSKYLELTHLDNPRYIFLLFLIVFTLDAVVNFFIDIPVLVPFAIFMLPVLWFNLLLGGKRLLFLCIFISVFLLASVVNAFLYPFDKRNISDMLFIIYFATSYFFYKQKSDLLNLGTVNIFIVVCIFMSGLAFFGYDSKSFAYDGAEYEKKVELLKKEYKKIRVSFDNDRLNTLESDKEYHFGLFRMPHLASYFFGFTSIFFGFLFARSLRWYFLVVAMILFMLMLYTGVRTFIAAAILALLVYLFRKKTIIYFLSLTILVALAFIFRYEINSLIKIPFLKAYTGLPILIVDNFDRLSRVLLWKSWWLDVLDFSWYDFIFGKTFLSSLNANAVNLHSAKWFHNDFLSILYCYGFFALMLYIWLFVIIYRDNADVIKSNIFVFIFYFSMIFTALLNGFYYYYPIFILFLFFYLVRCARSALKPGPIKMAT